MYFNISEKTQKKLDEMINGFMKTEESEREQQRVKTKTHLMTYHFETFDEIVEYLKDGGVLFFNDCYDDSVNECILYNPNTDMVELWKNKESVVVWEKPSLTFDEFKDKYFFSLLEDGSGYIFKFHKKV